MSDFIDYIRDIHNKKLAEYKLKMEEQVEASLAALREQVKDLEAKVDREKSAALRLGKAQIEFSEKQRVEEAAGQGKASFLRERFTGLAREVLADEASHRKWMTNALAALPAAKGRITAGKSLPLLKQLMHGHDIELAEDPKLADTPGFRFESDKYVVDATADTFITELFETRKADIHRLLFDAA
jgi:hypothetical protein